MECHCARQGYGDQSRYATIRRIRHPYGLFNVDLPPGQKLKLAELKALAEQEQELTEEQEQEFLDKLAEHREHKTTSARASNAAAARDMLCTSDAINREVSMALHDMFQLLTFYGNEA